jgi:hypothetical protein
MIDGNSGATVSNSHKKPVLAFVLLVMLATVIISLQLRANAAGGDPPGGAADPIGLGNSATVQSGN